MFYKVTVLCRFVLAGPPGVRSCFIRLPYFAVLFLQVHLVSGLVRHIDQWKVTVFQVFTALSYANSAINPVLYAFTNNQFKESFKAAWPAVVVQQRWRHLGTVVIVENPEIKTAILYPRLARLVVIRSRRELGEQQ